MNRRFSGLGAVVALAASVAFLLPARASAQNIASAKAFFAEGTNEEVLIQGADPVTILTGQLKTSTVGDLMIGVSLECALWTATKNTATKGGGQTSSTSRAAVNVTVYVNGLAARPGQVVYCDREQTVNLTFSSLEVIATDAITLELFLKTKNANHFNFYYANPGASVHDVVVKATGMVAADPDAPAGSTRAAIGKRTMVIEEFNSSNK
jgi:hypothetical protein